METPSCPQCGGKSEHVDDSRYFCITCMSFFETKPENED
jgi:hypothetical protein